MNVITSSTWIWQQNKKNSIKFNWKVCRNFFKLHTRKLQKIDLSTLLSIFITLSTQTTWIWFTLFTVASF